MIAAPRPAPRLPAPARVVRASARAQGSPSRPPSEPVAPQVLQTLETAALVLAVGAHVGAAAASRRHRQGAAQQPGQEPLRAVALSPPPEQAWQAPGGLWLTLPLVAALAFGRLRAWLLGAAAGKPSAGSPLLRRVGDQTARLVRLEATAEQQAARLDVAARQLDKLAVRSRLAGRDLKLPIQQLQAAAGQQSEALVALAQRMERFEREVRDTEALVEAMQGVSAKQFQLLLKVLEQQQQGRGQGSPPPTAPPPRSQPRRGGSPPPPQPPRGGAGPQAPVSSGGSGPASGADGGATDEWGRRVVPLPPSAAAQPRWGGGGTGSAAGQPGGGPGNAAEAAEAVVAAEAAAAALEAAAAAAEAAAAAALAAPSAAARDEAAAAAAGEGGAAGGGAAADRARGSGLGLDSFLTIIAKDAYFQAEQDMIRAVVNQPRPSDRPAVEVLPPLWPPADAAPPPQPPRQRQRSAQAEEWRRRMARRWELDATGTAEAAALARSSQADGDALRHDGDAMGPTAGAEAEHACEQGGAGAGHGAGQQSAPPAGEQAGSPDGGSCDGGGGFRGE